MVDLVKGNEVAPPDDLAFEDTEAPGIGGVRVRALTLSQRMRFRSRVGELRRKGGDSATFDAMPDLLEMSVVDVAGRPVYSAQRWDVYGSKHEDAAQDLFNAAMRISGLNSDDGKKN
jgi:hypothetical protein